jgi:repressor LexA
MKDAGILDGDLLAVHKTQKARNGQIVVARIEDEVTVKRYEKLSNQAIVHLHPENDEFSVIEVNLKTQEFAIEGLSVGIIRRD